eukprot:scaffold6599_cov61-Cyclotella_meneghiniana.AAC.6
MSLNNHSCGETELPPPPLLADSLPPSHSALCCRGGRIDAGGTCYGTADASNRWTVLCMLCQQSSAVPVSQQRSAVSLVAWWFHNMMRLLFNKTAGVSLALFIIFEMMTML